MRGLRKKVAEAGGRGIAYYRDTDFEEMVFVLAVCYQTARPFTCPDELSSSRVVLVGSDSYLGKSCGPRHPEAKPGVRLSDFRDPGRL